MLRGLLRDSEAARELFDKVGLFKAPEVLEKYVIASEVTVEVLDLFLSRVFGTERACIGSDCGDLKPLLESLACVSLSGRKGTRSEDSPAGTDKKETEGLRAKVEDLERQLCAVQRQLHMQGEVSQLAASLDGRLDEIARECERGVSDVRLEVSAVSSRLEKEMGERASAGDVRSLSDEVSRLKEGERRLASRISDVEGQAAETERVVRDEIQGELKRLDTATKLSQMHHQDIVYDAENPAAGIIAHLTRECGGNVHEKGIVTVTGSSFCSDDVPENAVDLRSCRCFMSTSSPNSWIRYDFKGRRVAPTSYSIRTSGYVYAYHPRSWVLEVSNGGSEDWDVVDSRQNNDDLNGPHLIRNFAISAPPSGAFRFVRLRQTGKSTSQGGAGDDTLCIAGLELFGTLSSH